MSSTFGGLNTVVRGLAAQQVSLNTVGHNISNSSTVGYSRQNVNLSTTRPENIFGAHGDNQLGTGVSIDSIMRARDTFMDRQMWKETSTLGYGQTVLDTLGRVEGVFSEPSDTGVQTTLNSFWSSWQTLATNANDDGTRTAVRQRGVEVVDAIQHAAKQLTDMVVDTNSVIDIKTNKINQISEQLYSLNRQIVTVETGGMDHANDLRDARDVLVDQLSKIVNVHVTEDKYGNYNVQSSNVTLVDGAGYQKLATVSSKDPDYGYELRNVVMAGSSQPLKFTGGELGGLIEMRDADTSNPVYAADGIKGYLKKLDTISKFLLQDFNDVHKTGLDKKNDLGDNFFGAAGVNYNVPASAPAPDTLGWIAMLKVNPVLFNTTDGLSKIAAKTAINNFTIQQSNGAGGAGSITSTYTGSTPLNYVVKIGGTPSALSDVTGGVVNKISVSRDNGVNWTEVTPVGTTFTLPGVSTGQKVTMEITTDSIHNKIGDTYTFSVNQGNAAGNNAINLANRLKTDTSTKLGGSSLDSYYSSTIGTLGVQAQSAKSLTTNQTTLVAQIENWRQSVSGVNVDEEMSNMIRFNKGYSAAARVLTAMDEMLDKLINGTGMVGR